MSFLTKFIAKIVLNGVDLYVAKIYFSGFVLTGGLEILVAAAFVLTLIHTFIRPVIRLISAPLIWLSFGLFNFIINMVILWLADKFLTQLAINDLVTLFWVSVIVALANSFF